MSTISVSDAAVTACASAAAPRYLRICDEAIEQAQILIRDIEAGNLSRGQKRRALFKARATLGELQCSAERVRRTMGIT